MGSLLGPQNEHGFFPWPPKCGGSSLLWLATIYLNVCQWLLGGNSVLYGYKGKTLKIFFGKENNIL